MTDHHDDKVMDHDYDGIKECNNPLPRWWLGTFYITIVFAVAYYFVYEINKGPTLVQEHEAAMAQINAVRQANAPKIEEETDDQIFQFKNEEGLKLGAEVYTGKCAACHGPELQGLIGPNLTDDYWIHGAKATDMAKVIRTGVADKGMPPWGELLKKEEVYAVISFISTKKGSNPPNPKAPQGDLVQ